MTTIITKNSSTASSVPSAAQLVQGELAVNVTDRRLFTENSSGTVVELGTNPSSLTLPNGTANGVAYLNGSKVLTTGSALTFDGTNLGVGTSSLSSLAQRTIDLNAASNSALVFKAADTTFAYLYADNAANEFRMYGGSSKNLTFYANAAEQMRLTSTGLGIGTSSPQYKGHFFTNANSGYGIQVGGTSGVAGDYTGILMSAANASGASPYYSGAIRIQTTVNSPSTQEPVMAFMLQDAGTFALANMTEKMRLTGSGNLGLGVTPSAWGNIFRPIQIGTGGSFITGRTDGIAQVQVGANSFFNGTNWIYVNSTQAGRYLLNGAEHSWYTAPSGTAGNAISFTQAMTLDASGNLGIGATSPSSKLDVSGGATTTTIRVRQTAAGSASEVRFGDDAGTDGGLIIKGGSSYGSYGGANSFMFWNNRSGPVVFGTNDTERARIDSSGNLLVGTTTSGVGNTAGTGFGYNGGASYQSIGHINGTASGSVYVSFGYNGGAIGNITQNGTTAVAYNTSSDYRLKNITGPITNSGAYIDSLNPVEGTWKADGSTFVGLIAHEVQEVSRTQVATGVKDGEEMQGMDYSSAEIIANLIAEVKSLRARVAALESI